MSYTYNPLTTRARLDRIDRSIASSAPVERYAYNAVTPIPVDVSDPFLSQPFSMDEDLEAEPVVYLPTPTLSRLPASAKVDERDKRPLDLQGPSVAYTESLLPSIDLASWHLHNALHDLRPVSQDYAAVSYPRVFNWRDIRLPREIEGEWYIVAFRSKRNLEANGIDLYEADKEAHEEAVQNGGLLLYWYGVPNAAGENLATCIWQSREHALAAMHKPKHKRAMALAGRMYKGYDLERWMLRKRRGRRELDLIPYRKEL